MPSNGRRARGQPGQSVEALVEQIRAVLFRIDGEGRWAYLNPAWETFTGYRISSSLRRPWIEFLHPDDCGVGEDLVRATAGDETVRRVARFQQKAGGYRYAELHAQAVRDGAGGPGGVAGMLVDMDQRLRKKHALDSAARSIGETGKAFFQTLVERLASAADVEFTLVGELVDRTTVQTIAVWDNGRLGDNFRYDLRPTPCHDVTVEGIACFPDDVQKQFPRDKHLRRLRARSYAGVCLWDNAGEPVGVMALIGRRPFDHSEHIIELIRTFVPRGSAELERMKVAASLRLGAQVFQEAAEGIMVTDAVGRIISVNPAFTALTGYHEDEAVGRPVTFRDASGSGAPDDPLEAAQRKGRWQGEVEVWHRDGSTRTEWRVVSPMADGHGRITRYIHMFSDISERKAAARHIEFLARFDTLTHLPNRNCLEGRVDQAVRTAERQGHQVALLFLDLDHFKNINDSLGHDIGDQLLVEVAGRLRTLVRESDIVARLGGDEFVVILPGLQREEDAGEIADKIILGLAKPCEIQGYELGVTPSIGISVFPRDGKDLATLIKNGDTAMYQAKAEGRNGCRFFAPEMNTRAMQRLELESGLRRAIEEEEFELAYQPVVDLASGQVRAVEGLLRWRAPTGDFIPPDRFIPVAEESGWITVIGKWVIQEACRQLHQWRREGRPVVPVAINVSAVQLGQQQFVDNVRQALATYDLPGDLIIIEITETALMTNTDNALRALRAFAQMGIPVAVDDFGTGYSSLAYLKRFPISALKIDRTFVADIGTDPQTDGLVRAVIQIAHSLGLDVIAEGVETDAQLAFLRQEQCHAFQGYLFCRPVCGGNFDALVKQSRDPVSPAFS